MIPQITKNINPFEPLKGQVKPSFVCEPGDPRVSIYGWTKEHWTGYISIIDRTIYLSAIWSLKPGIGNLSRLIKNIHEAGYEIRVPNPFGHMEQICKHHGFTKIQELFPEAGENITVYVLTGRKND